MSLRTVLAVRLDDGTILEFDRPKSHYEAMMAKRQAELSGECAVQSERRTMRSG